VEPWTREGPTEDGLYWFVGRGVVRDFDKPIMLSVECDKGAWIVTDPDRNGSWLHSWSGRWQRVVTPGPPEGNNGS
jgi:hypothetical protein